MSSDVRSELEVLIIPRDNTGFIYYSGVAVDKQY